MNINIRRTGYGTLAANAQGRAMMFSEKTESI
jgi:hypothetical protein